MNQQLDTADASATKGFFVDMLVRDIVVEAAILDLIDNAVDAARRHATGNDLGSFRVEVTLSPDRFVITDNCGGIPVETARHNAFRFGRAPGFNPPSTIGQFGIGMKRAMFRLGKKFVVDSSTDDERFVIDVDVEEWREIDGEWTFPMDTSQSPTEQAGTRVEVTDLHSGVQESFGERGYAERLLNDIASRHSVALDDNFQIIVNNESAAAMQHKLHMGAQVIPERQDIPLEVNGQVVNMRIVAGIGPEKAPSVDSGWYVYCNGRLVLRADRSELTGWHTGDVSGESGVVPAWHPQYQRFRGFVFFTSDDPGALPWTTTKDEIDQSSEIYRSALEEMRSVIRRYATYTNEEKTERELFEESEGAVDKVIERAVEDARAVVINAIKRGTFRVPARSRLLRPLPPPGPRTTRVCFDVPVSQIDELKEALMMKTNKQVGEHAFALLYDREIR